MKNLTEYLYEGINDDWKVMKSTLTSVKSYKTIYKSGETSVDLNYSYLYFSHPVSNSMIEAINNDELKKAANEYTNNPQSFPSFKLVIYSSASSKYSWIKRGMSYDGVSNKTVKAGETYIELHIKWGDKLNMPNMILTSDAIQYDFKDIKDFIKNYVKSNICKNENTFIDFVKSLNKIDNMKDLKTLLEASLLDIDGTFEEGDKYENLTLTELFNSKTQLEFETKFNVFRSLFESDRKGTEIHVIKPRNTYIAFVENTSMKSNDPDLCRDSIYIGTNNDLYRLTWVKGSPSRMQIKEMITLSLDYFTERQRHLNTSIYICPKKIKDEANKLIIYNLE